MRASILRGSLREFSLGEWLQALALSRTYLGLEVREGGAVVGTVLVKSGNVVHAEAEGFLGLAAWFRLRNRSDGEVDVFSNDTPDQLPDKLASIDELLREMPVQAEPPTEPNLALEGYVPEPPPLPSAAGYVPQPPPLPSAAGYMPQPPPLPVEPARAFSEHSVEHAEEPPVAPAEEPTINGEPASPLAESPTQAIRETPATTPGPGVVRARASSPPPAMPATTSARPITNAPPRRSSPPPAPAPVARGAAPHERRTVPPPSLAEIRQAKAALPGRILAISSPKGGCGKTTVALNLSLSLARQGRSVILIDADINGDVLSTINARQRAEIGVFDVLLGVADCEEALLDTVLPHFKILPAVGGQLPRPDLLAADQSAGWQALLLELGHHADVVVIDTPAGMYGVTYSVLLASTHVLGILQAEAVANRSFPRFLEAIRAMPDELRPEVAGIVVNMLQTKHAASLAVFQNACNDMPGDWLFDTSIPRHKAFLDATHAGLPLRQLDEQSPPAVAWLFDNLAGEVADRLRLGNIDKKPQSLLL